MGVVVGIVVLVLIGLAVWYFVRRDSRSTSGMDALPDDLRRADDGRPQDPFSDYGNPMGPTGNR